MHPANLAKFNHARAWSHFWINQQGPFRALIGLRPIDRFCPFEPAEMTCFLYSLDTQLLRAIAYPKRGDGCSCHRAGECFGGGLQHLDFGAAQTVREEGFQSGSVPNVQPLGGGNEAAEVAGRSDLGNLRKKVQVEAGKLARLDPVLCTDVYVPSFPGGTDAMVPHVWRIAQEQGRPWSRLQCDFPEIFIEDSNAVVQSREPQVRLQDGHHFRVVLYGDHTRSREGFGGGY